MTVCSHLLRSHLLRSHLLRSLLLLLPLLLLFAACQQGPTVVCEKPYILVGDSCCLDKNDDAICDSDVSGLCDRECPELDCTKCPAQVIERNVTEVVTKYICQKTGAVVATIEECRGNNLAAEFTPVTTNEENTPIDELSLRPACRDGHNAVEIHYTLADEPDGFTVEIKDDPAAEWTAVYTTVTDELEGYFYGGICENKCTDLVQFFLQPDDAYLVRVRFDFTSTEGREFLSNEHVVDTTEESAYRTKFC
ncbi:hypothetical protein D6789_03135 [Candidatus Woesearchaeota archaeon]|nr:MAG: hypothetical protein D6789_03135 [Candidatus Woesearchaeota archaeon]